MLIAATPETIAQPIRSAVGRRSPRVLLLSLTVLATFSAAAMLARTPAQAIDPDLVRLLRFMALMKGGFALLSFAACLWRLARPAPLWRTAVYVIGPPAMMAGAIGLWSLQGTGAAALGLHVGLFAVLAAALTDADFLPDLPGLMPLRRDRARRSTAA